MSPTYSVCRTHGYISGEHFECPVCGASAEVYSRITGYYRPVNNWNDGKSQEYKDRLVYNIDHKAITENIIKAKAAEAAACPITPTRVMLFATKTCPKCKIAASMLDKEGIEYEKLFVEDNEELARGYGLKQAPTLVVESAQGTAKFVEIAGVKEFIANQIKA